MKIGIDARLYGLNNRGIGRYLQNLIAGLEKIDKENRYVVFLRKDNWSDYEPKNPNFTKALADYREYGWHEQAAFPAAIRREKADLMHFPHFNVPILYKGKFIVTIHDLIPLKFSSRQATTRNFFIHTAKRSLMKIIFVSAVRRAQRIIFVSEYTKKDIVGYFGTDPDKIQVIYEGVPRAESEIREDGKILKKLKISGPFLLYVGAAYPHKNLERLLEAFQKLQPPASSLQPLKLVFVGKEDYFYKKLRQKAKDMGLKGGTVFTGYVSDSELAGLYENASLYVFPSLCEGFGLPPLEAMSRGLPVASSNASCLPEILGDAAQYFDPRDINDIIRTVERCLDDDTLRREMERKGLERAKTFDWEKCAQETLGQYLETARANQNADDKTVS